MAISRPWFRSSGLLALSLVACLEQAGAPLPCDDLESGSTITVRFAAEPGGIEAWAYSDCELGIRSLAPDETLYSLLFDESLLELMIPEGSLEIVGGDEYRPLPTARQIRRFDPKLGDWVTESGLDPQLRSIRISAVDPAPCFAARRCPSRVGGQWRCQTCEPDPPTPPALPDPPVFIPCPADWTLISGTADAPDACAPPTPPPPVACTGIETQGFGAEACASIGPACPSGDYSDQLPPGPVLYVAAGALPGGAGTIADPMDTIDAALAAAAPGTTIALSKGQHLGARLSTAVQIVGACADATSVSSPGPPIFDIDSTDVEIRDLQIVSTSTAIDVHGASSVLTLSRVAVIGGQVGLLARDGAQTVGADLLFRAQSVFGVHALAGAGVSMADSVIEGGRIAMLGQGPNTQLDLAALVVRQGRGPGLVLEDGAELEAGHVLVEDRAGRGIELSGGHAQLSDIFVRRTDVLPEEVVDPAMPDKDNDRKTGSGLYASRGSLVLDRASFEQNVAHQLTLFVPTGQSLTASVSQVFASDSTSSESAIVVQGDIHVRLEKIRVVDDARIAIRIKQGLGIVGPRVSLADVMTRTNTVDNSIGLHIAEGRTDVEADRLFLEGSKDGVVVSGSARVVLRDLTTRMGVFGASVSTNDDDRPSRPEDTIQIEIARALFIGGTRGTILRQDGASSVLSDLTVRGARHAGLTVSGTHLHLERIRIESVQGSGLDVDQKTVADIFDLEIDGVAPSMDGETSCIKGTQVGGICVEGTSEVVFERFKVAGSSQFGYVGAPSTLVQFRSGVFTNNAIAMRWPGSVDDLLRHLDRVQIFDNGELFDTE